MHIPFQQLGRIRRKDGENKWIILCSQWRNHLDQALWCWQGLGAKWTSFFKEIVMSTIKSLLALWRLEQGWNIDNCYFSTDTQRYNYIIFITEYVWRHIMASVIDVWQFKNFPKVEDSKIWLIIPFALISVSGRYGDRLSQKVNWWLREWKSLLISNWFCSPEFLNLESKENRICSANFLSHKTHRRIVATEVIFGFHRWNSHWFSEQSLNQ